MGTRRCRIDRDVVHNRFAGRQPSYPIFDLLPILSGPDGPIDRHNTIKNVNIDRVKILAKRPDFGCLIVKIQYLLYELDLAKRIGADFIFGVEIS